MHTYTHMYTDIHTRYTLTHVHPQIHTYIHVYTLPHIHLYIHIHIHTDIHTHTTCTRRNVQRGSLLRVLAENQKEPKCPSINRRKTADPQCIYAKEYCRLRKRKNLATRMVTYW